VALTDHDGHGGIAAAHVAAREAGIQLLPGAELSCTTEAGVRIHLLGYGADPADSWLAGQLAEVRDDRLPRAQRIVEALAADGVPITMNQVVAVADGAVIGRPHLAAVLVGNGVVPDVATAFTRYLADDAGYYQGHRTLAATEAVRRVAAAGGATVLAHARARRGPLISEGELRALAEAGMAGLEVDHVDHSDADVAWLAGLAADLGLIRTGGSDYHGRHKEGLPVGARTTSEPALAALLDLIRTPLLGAGAPVDAAAAYRQSQA
jgi:3',5'-nucleoside bisphosphate phosphatase